MHGKLVGDGAEILIDADDGAGEHDGGGGVLAAEAGQREGSSRTRRRTRRGFRWSLTAWWHIPALSSSCASKLHQVWQLQKRWRVVIAGSDGDDAIEIHILRRFCFAELLIGGHDGARLR